ncbi:MAG: hypothetical protein JJ992_13705 [Planctomycetes bacterium]|nr:hypothetical protein [Planctomycetota bacterium]
MKLYTELLRNFLKAGIMFGVVLGLLLGVLTNWKVGVIYGVSSALCLWLAVSSILSILSVVKKRPHHGSTGDERLHPDSSH